IARVASDSAASESGPDNGTFTVSRTGDTSNALLVSSDNRGPAELGRDYRSFPTAPCAWFPNLTIPAGASSADITVTPIDDDLAEGSETVVLELQQPDWARYLVGTPSRAVVTIADNDLVGTNLPPEVQMVTPRDGATFVG